MFIQYNKYCAPRKVSEGFNLLRRDVRHTRNAYISLGGNSQQKESLGKCRRRSESVKMWTGFNWPGICSNSRKFLTRKWNSEFHKDSSSKR